MGVDRAQDAFDAEIAQRLTDNENEVLANQKPPIDPSTLSPDERKDALKKIGERLALQGTNDAAGTSRITGVDQVFGDLTDGLSNLGQAFGIGNQASGASGFVDADGLFHPRTCFVKGTLVHLANGTKPIEEIKIGDKVKSWDEETGEYVIGEVTELYRHTVSLLFEIRYANGTILETTWNHPFWIVGRGWVEAKDIRVGDFSLSVNGALLTVASVTQKSVSEVDVYNFEVADTHVYMVGDGGVVVHNYTQDQRNEFARQEGNIRTNLRTLDAYNTVLNGLSPDSDEYRNLKIAIDNLKIQIQTDYNTYANAITRRTASGENKVNMFARNPTTGEMGGYMTVSGSLFPHNNGANDFNAGPGGRFYSPFTSNGAVTLTYGAPPITVPVIEADGSTTNLVRGIYRAGGQIVYWSPPLDANGVRTPGPDVQRVYTPANEAERVRLANSPLSSHGNSVRLRTSDNTEMIIMHLASQEQTGAPIQAGAVIGRIGSTGFSLGNHGHIEISVPSANLTPAERADGTVTNEFPAGNYRVDVSYYLNHIQGRQNFNNRLNDTRGIIVNATGGIER